MLLRLAKVHTLEQVIIECLDSLWRLWQGQTGDVESDCMQLAGVRGPVGDRDQLARARIKCLDRSAIRHLNHLSLRQVKSPERLPPPIFSAEQHTRGVLTPDQGGVDFAIPLITDRLPLRISVVQAQDGKALRHRVLEGLMRCQKSQL